METEKLEAARPHIEAAMNALIEMWDALREAESILDREIETDQLSGCGVAFNWNIGDTLTIENLKLILDQE